MLLAHQNQHPPELTDNIMHRPSTRCAIRIKKLRSLANAYPHAVVPVSKLDGDLSLYSAALTAFHSSYVDIRKES